MNWNTINTGLRLLPAIVIAIKALEDAIPTPGQGTNKLAALRGIVVAIDESAAALWPAIEKVVGIVVAAMNAAGMLSKKD
jgi:hypothetical protein